MRQHQRAASRRGARNGAMTRLARTAGALGLMMVASGCLEIDKPELALDIPDSYKTAHGPAEAATPALDWWRSFRSRELTSLMEQGITANFDIAIAIAQADAQVRIAGAPLLPTIDYNASDTASKASEQVGGTGGTAGRGGGSPFS